MITGRDGLISEP